MNGLLLYTSIINNSEKAVTITSLSVETDYSEPFMCKMIPVKAQSRSRFIEGKKVLLDESFTLPFPVTIPDLSSAVGYIYFSISQETAQRQPMLLTVAIHTNRRKIIRTSLDLQQVPRLNEM